MRQRLAADDAAAEGKDPKRKAGQHGGKIQVVDALAVGAAAAVLGPLRPRVIEQEAEKWGPSGTSEEQRKAKLVAARLTTRCASWRRVATGSLRPSTVGP